MGQKNENADVKFIIEQQEHLLTSLEIITPPISEEISKQRCVYEYICEPELGFRARWSKFLYKEVKTISNIIKNNFQFERGTLISISEPKFSYLLCFNLYGKKLTRSKKWVVAGCMSVSEELIIDWIWIHPFLRDQGLTASFLASYACNEAPLMMQAPISKKMKFCQKKSQEMINSSSENLLNFYHQFRKHFSNLFSIDIKEINLIEDVDFAQLLHCFQAMEAEIQTTEIDIDKEKQNQMMKFILETKIRCAKDPIFKDELIKSFPDFDLESFQIHSKETINKFKDFGDARTYNAHLHLTGVNGCPK